MESPISLNSIDVAPFVSSHTQEKGSAQRHERLKEMMGCVSVDTATKRIAQELNTLLFG